MAKRPLGLVRAGTDPDVITMICTAGHVDHGKTSLVKLLTGCETDRLRAEKERGLTIEVGFAPCYLGDDLSCGIADVPGHEKFVRTMVAGVSGIDLGLLVVAADDGVMPQTVEHLRIMELLGVRQGLTALTKIDLVDEERVREVREEVAAFLEGTFLEGRPICPLSAKSGDGFFPFYETLTRMILELRRERGRGLFRMPIDKVFVTEAMGTVVTGIPVAGSIACGDRVESVPGGATGRVRAMERFGRKAERGGTGQCLALQIPDLAKKPPTRGDVIALPGTLRARDRFEVKVALLPELDPPLRHQEQVKFHVGRSETHAKLYTFDGKPLAAGTTGYATITLEEPVGAACHDRFILRRPSPAMTVAGGEILAIPAGRGRRRKREALAALQAKDAFLGESDPRTREGVKKRVEWHLREECRGDCTREGICLDLLLPPEEAAAALAELREEGRVLPLGEEIFIHRERLARCLAEAERRIEAAAGEEQVLSLDANTLRREMGCSPPLWERVAGELAARGKARVKDGKLLLQDAHDDLPPADRRLRERILEIYERTGWKSPRPEELPDMLGEPPGRVKKMLEPLCHAGDLVRLSKNVVVSQRRFREAQDKVVETIEREGFLDSSQFKHMIGSTRKYALAMLDYLDTRHITMRVQHNNRKLTSEYRKRLL